MIRTLTAMLLLGLTANLEPGTLVVFIVLLDTERPRRNALAFLAGWFVSLAVVFLASYSVLHGRQPVSGSTEERLVQVGEIVVGLLLVWLAVHEWRRWRRVTESPAAASAPAASHARWLRHVGPRSAFFAAMWEQPWTVTMAAAVVVMRAGLIAPEAVAAFLVFACASSALIGTVWLVFRHDPSRAQRLLQEAEARVRTKGPRVFAILAAVAAVALLADGVYGLVRS